MKITLARAASVAGVVFVLGGCGAYMKVMDSLPASSGSVKVVNTMSVPVCSITMVNKELPGRNANDLRGGILRPGAEAVADVPMVGKLTERKPQPDKFDLQVYGCKDGPHGPEEGGALLLTLNEVDVRNSNTVAIR